MELGSINRQVGGSCSMIKVCVVSSTNAGGGWEGSTCQRDYRVKSILWQQSHSNSTYTLNFFSKVEVKALHLKEMWFSWVFFLSLVLYFKSKLYLCICVNQIPDTAEMKGCKDKGVWVHSCVIFFFCWLHFDLFTFFCCSHKRLRWFGAVLL